MEVIESIQQQLAYGKGKRTLELFAPDYNPATSSTLMILPQTHIWTKTRSGSGDPDWKNKVRQLKNATHPYSRDDQQCTAGQISYSAYLLSATVPGIPTGMEVYDGTHFFVPTGTVTEDSGVYESALGNFLSNAHEAVAPFLGGAFMAELKETLKMIRRPASALRDGITEYLKRSRQRLRRERFRTSRKVLAGTWLEYVYGWRPLVADIEAACSAYDTLQGKIETFRAEGASSKTWGKKSSKFADAIGGTNYGRIIKVRTEYNQDRVQFKGVVVEKFDETFQLGASSTVQRACGFDLHSFIPTAWELIPYSFVADMFTNIGTILNSTYGATATWSWKSVSRDTKLIGTQSIEIDRTNAYLPRYPSMGPGSRVRFNREFCSDSTCEKVHFSRSDPVIRLPSLVISLPGSAWSWANLAALIAAR
jgi:hypothetical protein